MRKNLLLTCSLLLAAVFGLRAQGITTSSISGKITDSKGEALPGANVLATHEPSKTTYGSITLSDGRYIMPAVRVGGPYTIRATFVGYEDVTKTGIELSLGQNFTLDFKLGESSTILSEIQVSAERDNVLNADRTGASTNIRKEQFERLPTITRSLLDFAALTPQAGSGGSFSFGGRSSQYNNFSIDGATSNNVFGLSALPGGQTNSQPISVDAIQEITVNLAPYDVRQGAFTGAGVNAITRSGTNEFSGSVYGFFRNQDMVGKKIGQVEQPVANFNTQSYGFRLGGPILKNKLFFFVNYENERVITPSVVFPVNTPGNQQTAITDRNDPLYNSPTNLARLKDFLLDPAKGWVFDPGTYENVDLPTQSEKYLAKIDWNINQNHKLTARFNQLISFRDQTVNSSGGIGSPPPGSGFVRSNSINALPFSSSNQRQYNNSTSFIAELNSSFGNKYFNTLTVGYTAFRDYREAFGGGELVNFPTVDIVGPNGNTLTTFGNEPFTPNNKLDQDIFQLNNNFNIFLSKHTISVGTANEFFSFYNRFNQQINGVYQFNSIQNFIDNVTNPVPAANGPTQFLLQYSALPDDPKPGAKWSATQLGFYAQDEYTGLNNVKITAGIRVDFPIFPTSLPSNPISDALTFGGGEKIQVGRLPDTTPLFSPRVGVNWDVFGDKTLQVRGGTGVFTGRIPFVWISNQVTNNGLLFGQINATGTAANSFAFSPVPLTSSGGPSPTFAINSTVPNFKFPQVWRTNIAIDKSLPWGMVGTLEAILTKDLNAIYVRDANFNGAIRNIDGDGRPQYPATVAPNPTDPTLFGRRINQNITQALVLDNNSEGYAYNLVAQLQKRFDKGFYGSAAYSYTDSRDLNSQSGTTSGGLINGNSIVGNINAPTVSYSSNMTKHRIILNGSYRKEYAKYFASTLSFIYELRSGNNFSYTYAGDLNSDGISGNDLIYIPRNRDEIILTTTNALDTRSVDQIWQQLDDYINQDAYLRDHRGQYAERNGAIAPWINSLNMRFLQDFNFDLPNGKRNTLQFSVEMINVLNWLDSSLGVVQIPARTQVLGFAGYENPAVNTANTQTNNLLPNNSYSTSAATGRPIFTFATNANGSPISSSYVDNTTTASRWQLQIGLRYIFN